ncbi:MAG: hypothetical protein GWM92_13675, partial [Gemmatimonadetes bacterium]|nr:heavy-metal-associated domain-containing protein [Gemmatimonadota bacterium]NIR79776.1 heavy-metal-associated domain-containing protein [Gemmatimonadota bacterium]NIT88472.1 heavy-metal-associated domain-containing protein [Gemmatimonadota bacterium]NIU32295.1 heavy-metal-associated domain-containing protein [Gemmatimonadota bacterium]NIU36832.1 hypothetical protein [Gemmatimonadota bacterium]
DACASRVERALAGVEGVDRVRVSLEEGIAEIRADERTDHERLVSAVGEAGYEATGAG